VLNDVYFVSPVSRNQNASDFNVSSSLTMGSNDRHYVTSQSAAPPQRKPTISGVFFVLKHWISKHYYVSYILLLTQCSVVVYVLKLR